MIKETNDTTTTGENNTFATALEFMLNKEHTKAFTIFEKLAKEGDCRAQFFLSKMFLLREGTEYSVEKTVYWMTESADQGYVDAQVWLSNWYRQGNFVKQNDEKAMYYCTLAAEQGDQTAFDNLKATYQPGKGMFRDYNKTLRRFSEAKEKMYFDLFPETDPDFDKFSKRRKKTTTGDK